MAGVLRAAAGALRTGLSEAGGAARAAAQQQQRRATHELSAHQNKHVEAWIARRESIEDEFRWTKTNTRAVLLGGILLPIAMYNAVAYAFHKDDDFAERPRRDFLWSHGERGPGAQ